MYKIRLHLTGSSYKSHPKSTPLSVAKGIIAQGRPLDFQTGLSVGLFRQCIYTTARVCFFERFIHDLQSRNGEGNTTLIERCGAGLLVGGVGAFLGNPADLAPIRIQADGLRYRLREINTSQWLIR